MVRLLSQHQHCVSVLVRNPSKIRFPILPNVKICVGDLSNSAALAGCLDKIDAVVHTAADTTMGISLRAEQIEANITATANLIQASQQREVKRFIHISTANVFVPDTEAPFGTESQRVILSKSLLPYIQTKLQAEDLLLKKVRSEKFPALILNPTFMIGPEDYKPSSGQLILAILKGRLQFYPTGGKNIVDVRDVAEAIHRALSVGSIGENYLIGGQNISYQDLSKKVFEKNRIRKLAWPLPQFLSSSIGSVGSTIERLTRTPMTINHLTLKIASEFHYYSNTKAITELGFIPRPFHNTLTDTVNWLTHEHLAHKKSGRQI